MVQFILDLFKPRSVAQILSRFQEQIDELDKAIVYQKRKEGEEQQKASDALKAADEARTEAARAATVKEKINNLISG